MTLNFPEDIFQTKWSQGFGHTPRGVWGPPPASEDHPLALGNPLAWGPPPGVTPMCSGPTPPLGLEPQTQVLVFDPDHSNDKKFPVTSYYLSLERGLWRLGSIKNRKLGEIDKILRSFKIWKIKVFTSLKMKKGGEWFRRCK